MLYLLCQYTYLQRKFSSVGGGMYIGVCDTRVLIKVANRGFIYLIIVMKRFLFYILLIIGLFSCDKNEPEKQPDSNFLVKAYSKDILDEQGNLKGVWTDISLFSCEGLEYSSIQDVQLLKQLYALDVNGNKHYVTNCFSSSNGWLHYYIKPGKYLLCLIQKETGKHTYTIITLDDKMKEFVKVFESSLPKDGYENW